ncbi:hypothetical protein NEHOM01_0560 [Nematocida homosporus]|uniref:uncharacterized protein n=1 Tax=Nematocida homosporus TaxID=1912981 RepID=UPI00221EF676|nr:uncharacterized protein NEHOM01_0560 [Nematocida homosporus]KAI5185055.1 hypothetical protein NEHOM01_0560 [Nematocida homosporus]
MEEKKRAYEEEIAKVLRRVMEVSYARKKNSESISTLLKSIRKETHEEETPDSLMKEYEQLRERILKNMGCNQDN